MAAEPLAPSAEPISAEPMLRRVAVWLGWLSLLATLALLSPGIVATPNAGAPALEAPLQSR